MRTAELSSQHQRLIARADTFFIATDHPESGADISHRGGNPGFVRIVDSRRLAIPDYSGNNMFNTLGNIVANPRVGLLFIGFESGRTLQLTGRATIDWDSARASTLAGAARIRRLRTRRDGRQSARIPAALRVPRIFAFQSVVSTIVQRVKAAPTKKAAGRASRRWQFHPSGPCCGYASKRNPPPRRTIWPEVGPAKCVPMTCTG